MTDIFARKPTPNVPAPRYDLFISAFEKKVAEVQKTIEQTRGMERPYSVVRDALEAAKLPNATSLYLGSFSISINVAAVPTDKWETFANLLAQISKALHAAGLRDNDRPPAPTMGGCWHSANAHWQCVENGKRYAQIGICIDLPSAGIADLAVEPHTRTYSTTEYKIVPRKAPRGWSSTTNDEEPIF